MAIFKTELTIYFKDKPVDQQWQTCKIKFVNLSKDVFQRERKAQHEGCINHSLWLIKEVKDSIKLKEKVESSDRSDNGRY